MPTFRILHLSDFHIAVRERVFGIPDWQNRGSYPTGWREPFHPSSYDKELARALARHAFQWGERLDAILVTGDLATTGEMGDLDVACRYVSEPALPVPLPDQWDWAPWLTPSGSPTLQSSGAPVILLPGNHDRYDGWRKNAGGRNFDSVFQDFWDPTDGVQSVVLELEGEKLAIVMADLTLAENGDADQDTPWSYLGQGRVYSEVIQSLRDETLALREQHNPLAAVWAVHFPPGFAGIEPALRLLDEHLLVEAAREMAIAHIFCGHTHEPRQYALPGQPEVTVYCAGTAMQYCAPPPNSNCIHPAELVVNEGKVTSARWASRFWNRDNKDFE